MSNELKKHLETLNAESEARGNCLLITEDLDHWAESGVTTVAEFDRLMAIETYSDVYKDVNGFRPRRDWSNHTTEEIEKELSDLFRELEEQMAWEAAWDAKQAEIESQEQAEEEAAIAAFCEERGIDRETYNRWMREAQHWAHKDDQEYLVIEEEEYHEFDVA